MNTYANTDGCDMPAARAKRPAFVDMTGGYDFGKPLTAYGLTDEQAEYVLKVAREWQSPGSIGCELATLASTRCVTDELASDITRTIREAATANPMSGETALGIIELERVAELLGLEIDTFDGWGLGSDGR